MKKNAITALLTIGILLMVLLSGCADTDSFASVTDSELFAPVPMMSGEKITWNPSSLHGVHILPVYIRGSLLFPLVILPVQ